MELAIRIASALVFGPAVLAIVWFADGLQYSVFAAVLVLIGGWEWAQLAGSQSVADRALFALLVGALTLAALVSAPPGLLPAMLAVGLLVWLFNLYWLSRPQMLSEPQGGIFWFKLVLGILLLTVAGVSLGKIHQSQAGQGLTIVFLLIIWSADIGAYAAGRLFGRHKLAPAISPGKTWEGVFGGQLMVCLVVWLLLRYTPPEFNIGSWLFGLAALTAAISVAGDLFISILKRQRQLKDTGRLLPGHGGVLDRFDSAFAAAPFFLAGLAWAGRL